MNISPPRRWQSFAERQCSISRAALYPQRLQRTVFPVHDACGLTADLKPRSAFPASVVISSDNRDNLLTIFPSAIQRLNQKHENSQN
jgi:hypothetical protein